jgi:hypothetical protein
VEKDAGVLQILRDLLYLAGGADSECYLYAQAGGPMTCPRSFCDVTETRLSINSRDRDIMRVMKYNKNGAPKGKVEAHPVRP